MNTIPKKVRTDISRIRHWSTKNQAKYYRQTILLSHIDCAEIRSLLTQFCSNYSGRIILTKNHTPDIEKVGVVNKRFYLTKSLAHYCASNI